MYYCTVEGGNILLNIATIATCLYKICLAEIIVNEANGVSASIQKVWVQLSTWILGRPVRSEYRRVHRQAHALKYIIKKSNIFLRTPLVLNFSKYPVFSLTAVIFCVCVWWAESPCQNNGTCLDGVNEYTCLCQAGISWLPAAAILFSIFWRRKPRPNF